MKFSMTNTADRDNVEPIHLRITFVMVVNTCLATTQTLVLFCWKYLTSSDKGVDYTMGLDSRFVFQSIPSLASSYGTGADVRFSIIFLNRPAMLALSVCLFKIISGFLAFFASFVFKICKQLFFFTSFGSLPLSDKSTTAYFAGVAKAVFFSPIVIKFRNSFNLIATGASFCYDLLRHGFFLIKKSCLEPLQTQYLCGSFYINTE